MDQKEPVTMSSSLSENMQYLNKKLEVEKSFDLVYRVIKVGGRDACIYFIDGFCKDELMQKMLQHFEQQHSQRHSNLNNTENHLC